MHVEKCKKRVLIIYSRDPPPVMSSQSASQRSPLTKTNSISSVLLIDDEPDILTIEKRSLEMAKIKAYGFTHPVMALDHFKQHVDDYDLVVTDIRMPSMTGFELARAIKRIKPSVKIVFITAFDIHKDEFEKMMPSTKIDAFITKPVRPEAFAKTIARILSGE